MALMPKRVKYRKSQRGKMKCNAARANYVAFGEYGLQSLEQCWLKGTNIEAGRVAATHYLQREGKVYIRVFPYKPVSAKPLETRMGKGKGEPAFWVARVRPARFCLKSAALTKKLPNGRCLRVAHKMPMKCRLIRRRRTVG